MTYKSLRRKHLPSLVALCAAISLASGVIASCGSNGANNASSPGSKNGSSIADSAQVPGDVGITAPEVQADPDVTGAETAKRLFAQDGVDSVVVASAAPAAQLAAAQEAVSKGVPMLIQPDAAAADQVRTVVDQLGAKKATAFDVDLSGWEDVEVSEGAAQAATTPDAAAPAGLALHQRISGLTGANTGTDSAGEATTALVTATTSPAASATARAKGLKVLALSAADPRATKESMAAAQSGNLLALGPGFDQQRFDAQLQLVDAGEQPGGGGLVFPGRRVVALYGHPSGPALGVMGEQPPAESVAKVKDLAAQYQQHVDEPVVPAFEIIATVASDAPGPDGDYSNEATEEELEGYIDAITDAGGYAFLDLQPGRARLIDQAKRYENLLKRPNVGLALDPEWKISANEVPMTNVGHVDATEINEVSQWLAGIVQDDHLPQKGLIIHQFQLQMIRNREQVNTSYPELAFILHADGHGPSSEKMDTWNTMREGLSPDYFMAWKNFIDEDKPMYTPEQTLAVNPRPWFVSYQ